MLHSTAEIKGKNEVDPNCRDKSKACEFWAQKGFCESRRDFMLTDCKRSCNACASGKRGHGACVSNHAQC